VSKLEISYKSYDILKDFERDFFKIIFLHGEIFEFP